MWDGDVHVSRDETGDETWILTKETDDGGFARARHAGVADVGDQLAVRVGHDDVVFNRRAPRHDGSGGGERAHQSDVILDLAVHGYGSRRRRAERSSARSRGRGRRQAVAVGRRENHRSFDVRRRLRPRDVPSSGFRGVFAHRL
mgnify:CR=1 FL=1